MRTPKSLPWRRSLTARLLLTLSVATLLPLVLLMVAVLTQAYQATTAQTYETLQQTSRRYAADFGARLEEKLGLMKAIASLVEPTDDPSLRRRLLALDPALKNLWVHREGTLLGEEDEVQRALYEEVRLRQTEVLSPPDFERYEASLGFPIVEKGRFVGMVAVSFSLDYFQSVITGIHLYQTGYALLVSHEGYRIAHPNPQLIGVRVGNDVAPEVARTMLERVDQGQEFWLEKPALLTNKWSRQFYSPILVGRAWNPWFLVVVVPSEEATNRLNSLFLLLVAGTAATLLLVTGATWWAARSVVRPLRHLADSAEAIANGHYDTRVAWSSQDEVGTLAAAFNRMTDRLVGTLRHQEEMVRRRTAKLVDSEKLAVLGQLTATIAHEVNTPLGAIRSSATFVHQNVVSRAEDLPEVFRRMSPEELEAYRTLVLEKRVDLAAVTGAEDRRRRRALVQRLAEAGLAPDLADDIVFLVSAEDDEAVLTRATAGLGPAIRLAAQTASLIRASAIIVEAADRAAATVSALVDYARMEDLGSEQLIDPARELDTLMTLYYGVAKSGVQVIRDFQPGVMVNGDRDRLNQVWVNLINNALQAMEYRGRLVLSVKQNEQAAEVSVANDGPPVPEELREKIFEPFFTTKRAGLGTGLGLDVSRRIVEAHGGRLTLAHRDGFTVFTVALPLLDPDKPVH